MRKIFNRVFFVLFLVTFLISSAQTSSAGSSILGTTGDGPYGITIDSAGNIYTANNRSDNVTKITPGGVSTIFGTTGYSSAPRDITIDAGGNIYTANSSSANVTKITPGGVSTILGTTGDSPRGITIDAGGNIYTANTNSSNVTKITPGGVSTILGTTGSCPADITIDSAGNIYTPDQCSNTITKITPEGVSSVFANVTSPSAITIDSAGNIYTVSSSVGIVKITPAGESSILNSTFTGYDEIAIDTSGNIYTFLNYGVVKITPTGVFSLLEMIGSQSLGITIDSAGNIYTANNSLNNVTKITYDSLVTNTFVLSSEYYCIDYDASTIGCISYNTPKEDFLSNLIMGTETQAWDIDDISDPVVTGNTLLVTAEDGITTATYTITTYPPPSNDAVVTSEIYTITIDGEQGTITDIPFGTSYSDFVTNLVFPGGASYSGDINNPVQTGNTLTVYAQDQATHITYNITVYPVEYTIFWYNSGVDSNWGTLAGNWWLDESHTIQAENLPEGEDIVKTLGIVGPQVNLDSWIEPIYIDVINSGINFTSSNQNLTNVFILGNAAFYDTSSNGGVVSGNATFNDSTINYSTVEGYGCFRNESTNQGNVGGLLCPPVVITSPTTDIAQTSVTLNGEISDAIESVDVLGFEYGTNTSYGDSVTDEEYIAEETFSAQVSGLTCGTTYHFRAYGTNDFDTTYGEDLTFTTSPCPNGSSSGSSPSRPKTKPIIPVTCSPGQKYNTQTGQPCTSFTPNSNPSTPATPTTCTITLTLKQGNTGEQVKCLQTKLNISSDGIFGPMTKGAVIIFQKAHSLTPDGIVGKVTRAAMGF